MIISVSGTPGTGKTETSKALAGILSYEYIDLNILSEKKGLIIGFDSGRKSKIVDTNKLADLNLPEDSVVDGHLSHFVKSDKVVILRTRPDILKKRILKRNWPLKKVKENLESEILGVCSSEAYDTWGKERIIEVDTTDKTPEESALYIKKHINSKNTKEIDWLEDFDYMLE